VVGLPTLLCPHSLAMADTWLSAGPWLWDSGRQSWNQVGALAVVPICGKGKPLTLPPRGIPWGALSEPLWMSTAKVTR
jgi:hypothetical protein